MRTRRLVLAAGFLAIAIGGVHAAKGPQLNMPGDAIGDWIGGCTQTETQVHTTINAQIMQISDVGLMGNYQNAGTFFGCPPEDHGGYPSFKNRKPSGWTDHSIHAKGKKDLDDLLGAITAKNKGTTIVVKGKKACAGQGPKKYGGKGLLTGGNQFAITLTAKVQGETAHFDCSWTKLP